MEININLIKNVKSHNCIWDPLSPDYRKIVFKHIAWENIARSCNMSISTAQLKFKSLKTSYYRYKNKYELALKEKYLNASSSDDVHIEKPDWYLYDDMQFLDESIMRRKSKNYPINYTDYQYESSYHLDETNSVIGGNLKIEQDLDGVIEREPIINEINNHLPTSEDMQAFINTEVVSDPGFESSPRKRKRLENNINPTTSNKAPNQLDTNGNQESQDSEIKIEKSMTHQGCQFLETLLDNVPLENRKVGMKKLADLISYLTMHIQK